MSNNLSRIERNGNSLIFKQVQIAGYGLYDVQIAVQNGQVPTQAIEVNIKEIRQLAAQIFTAYSPNHSQITYQGPPRSAGEFCKYNDQQIGDPVLGQVRGIWDRLFRSEAAGDAGFIPEVKKMRAQPLAPKRAFLPEEMPQSDQENRAPSPVPQPALPQEEITPDSAEEAPEAKPVAIETGILSEDDFEALTDEGGLDSLFNQVAAKICAESESIRTSFPKLSFTSLQTKGDPAQKDFEKLLENPEDPEVKLIRQVIIDYYRASCKKRPRRSLEQNAAEVINFIPISEIDTEKMRNYLIEKVKI